MINPGCFIRIDVSKATLDVAVLPEERAWQVEREDAAIAALVGVLRRLAPRLFVPQLIIAPALRRWTAMTASLCGCGRGIAQDSR